MSSLPEDISYAILSRLPAKSTYICKCVCKSWCSIISNPFFVKMHLDYAQRNNNSLLFTTNYDNNTRNKVMYSVIYDSLLDSSLNEGHRVVELPYPKSNVDLLGSCNGLLCLRCYDRQKKPFMCLWNPASRELKMIPRSPTQCALKDIRGYALCYDRKTDDYKFLVAVETGDNGSVLVDIYMLRSNSWKTSQAFLSHMLLKSPKTGVLFNDALFWFGCKHSSTKPDRDRKSWLINCWDVSDEKFHEVQLPKEPMKNGQLPITMGVFEGCLSVLISGYMNGLDEIWVMQDYGVQESWTKRYIIRRDTIYTGYGFSWTPLWFFKDGVLLMSYWSTLVKYDQKHSNPRGANFINFYEPKNRGSATFYKQENLVESLKYNEAENYVESIVSLDSGIYMRERKVTGRRRK